MKKMKKSIVKSMTLLAVVPLWTACSSDVVDSAQSTDLHNEVVSIHVSNPGTRATVVNDYEVNERTDRGMKNYPTTGKVTNYKYIWAVGDALYTYDPNKNFVSTFICKSVDANGAGATFTSTDAKWTTDNTIYLFASQKKPTVAADKDKVSFDYTTPDNAGFAWGAADKNTAVLTNTNFTGIGKIDKCPELANNGTPVRMECTLDVTPSMTMYFRDMMHDYKQVSLTQSVSNGSVSGYYDGATYSLSGKTYTPGTLQNTVLRLADKKPESFEKGVIYMPMVETDYKKVTISLIGKNKNKEGDETTVRSIYTKNNFDATAQNNYYNLGDIAKWTKDADHLYIIGDATPFGWARSTAKNDSTRTWPFTQKMKNEGNGVFTYIGPAIGANNAPTQMYSPSTPDPAYQAIPGGDGNFKFYFFNNGLYEGAGLMRKTGNDTDKETTAYYSTYDNSFRADDKWKVVNAGVYKITVNVRTCKVKVEPYTGTLPTLQVTKQDGSKETINKLWLFGTATPVKNYTATMPLAMNYNAADDPNHFVWEGHLTKGYLKFPYIFGDFRFNQTSYLMPENGVTTTVSVANFANVHPTPIKTDGSSMKMIVGTNQDNQWEITEEGDYKIIVDVNNMKVTFIKK
jgi:lipoprotein